MIFDSIYFFRLYPQYHSYFMWSTFSFNIFLLSYHQNRYSILFFDPSDQDVYMNLRAKNYLITKKERPCSQMSFCLTMWYKSRSFFISSSSTPRRTCCEVRVMLCMTQYICAPLQSAGGFILEGDWTPTKTYLSQLTTYRGGSLIFFQDKLFLFRLMTIYYSSTIRLHNEPDRPIRSEAHLR